MGKSSGEEMQGLAQILGEHKLDIRDGSDKIRWGYRTTCQFNVKEVANLASGSTNLPTKKRWCKLWGLGHWPKITLFLWLLTRGRIMTWENLGRRGMLGPSVCVMCLKAEETTSHLLQVCEWDKEVWKKGITLLGKPILEELPIQNLIDNWSEKAFQNSILNRIWELLPCFVVWEIWKEWNSQIFEGKKRHPVEAWTLIYAHIKETLGLKRWDSQML